MTFLRTVLSRGLGVLAAVGLLAGCAKDETASPPPTSAPAAPTQYGTPFAGVPNPEDAVVYQVNIRAFSPAGNLTGVQARLDSIKALGANVVYLMPIHPVGVATGTHPAYNSPYAVQDYNAVNPEFGTLANLRALVDAAHARGLSVMLDWVANHTSWDHAWITQHPDWYAQNSAGAILSPGSYQDVAQLSFASAPMRLAMVAAMKSWIYTANVDGFRFDYADNPPADFWQQAVDTLRHVRSHKLLLLAEGGRSSHFAAGFDYTYGFSFYDLLRRIYANGQGANGLDVVSASAYAGATGSQQVLHYTTNHDVNGSDGTPVALYGGEAGAMSAFAVVACYQGIPMIYNGQEAGMTTRITFPFTSVKVQWGAHPAVTRAYRQLLTARANSAALRHGTAVSYSIPSVCAFTKTAGTEQALVLANVRNYAVPYDVPADLENTTWTDALQGGSITLSGQVTLPAYGYLVLKK